MDLYLMRHGEALTKAQDPLRPLSEYGKKMVTKVAATIQSSQVGITEILYSPILRAKETAQLLAEYVAAPSKEWVMLDAEADIKLLYKAVEQQKSGVLLVGHLPNLELLANVLITGNFTNSTITLAPGSIAYLKQEDDIWALQWLLDPQII